MFSLYNVSVSFNLSFSTHYHIFFDYVLTCVLSVLRNVKCIYRFIRLRHTKPKNHNCEKKSYENINNEMLNNEDLLH